MLKRLLNISFVLLFLLVPQAVFASSVPPQGSSSTLSSDGAAMIVGWNYFKVNAGSCSVKQVLNELQANGGSALTVDNLAVGDGNSFSSIDVNSDSQTSVPVDTGKIYAFNSNQKFFLTVDPKNCQDTSANNARNQQIEDIKNNVKKQNESQGNILDQLLSVPQSFWAGILSVAGVQPSASSNPQANAQANTTNKATFDSVTTSDSFVTDRLTAGLIWIDALEGSINSPSTLKIQPNGQLGGVDFLSGLVTIDKTGLLTSHKIAVSSDSLGHATLPSGQTSVTINNNLVTDTSEVFVTATSSTGGQSLFISSQTSGQGFTVSLDHSIATDVKFNWWIVDGK